MLIFRQITKAPQGRAGKSWPYENLVSKMHWDSCMENHKSICQSQIPTSFWGLCANNNTWKDHNSDWRIAVRVKACPHLLPSSLRDTVLFACSTIKGNRSFSISSEILNAKEELLLRDRRVNSIDFSNASGSGAQTGAHRLRLPCLSERRGHISIASMYPLSVHPFVSTKSVTKHGVSKKQICWQRRDTFGTAIDKTNKETNKPKTNTATT